MKVEYINTGTGNRVGDTIYLNRKLKNYPRLHDAIISHEKKHTGTITIKDFLLDVRNKELKGIKTQYYKFILNNPETWWNFLPIMKIKNSWTYDLNILILWLIAIGIATWIYIVL